MEAWRLLKGVVRIYFGCRIVIVEFVLYQKKIVLFSGRYLRWSAFFQFDQEIKAVPYYSIEGEMRFTSHKRSLEC